MKRRTASLAVLAAALALSGCTGLNTLTAEVNSFGEWPAGRTPGRYAFERLPSQQARAAESEALEMAAQAALQRAGFTPAQAGQEPDLLVQLGGRFSRSARSPWDEPLWWHGGFGPWRRGPWVGPSWQLRMHLEAPRHTYEVALLLRDRASGKPLYETRAASDGANRANAATVAALFQAALADFPRPALSPRQVTATLPP